MSLPELPLRPSFAPGALPDDGPEDSLNPRQQVREEFAMCDPLAISPAAAWRNGRRARGTPLYPRVLYCSTRGTTPEATYHTSSV
jgi:hypothetical protein